MRLLEKIKKRLAQKKDDPHKVTIKKPKTELTEQDIEEAKKQISTPFSKPNTRVIGLMFFVILWTVGHLFPLYVMIGTPISAGILLYVIVNILIFGHYFTLLNKERIK